MLTRRAIAGFLAALLLGTASAANVPEPGRLSVTVLNGWAHVFVDGERIGATPVKEFPLDPGPHAVRFLRWDMPLDRVVPVDVTAGHTTDLTVELSDLTAPTDGLLTVSSLPRSLVYIDGVEIRNTPVYQQKLPVGTHTVLLLAEDGRRKSFRVDVRGGAEVRRVWLFDEERWTEG